MLAFTVRRPYAWAIIHGGKLVENRSWPTKHRGPVLIHNGHGTDGDAAARFPNASSCPPGHVVGVVRVVDCHRATSCEGRCPSEWARDDGWHWVLSDPIPVDPFPMRGQLGLWESDLDLDLSDVTEDARSVYEE